MEISKTGTRELAKKKKNENLVSRLVLENELPEAKSNVVLCLLTQASQAYTLNFSYAS